MCSFRSGPSSLPEATPSQYPLVCPLHRQGLSSPLLSALNSSAQSRPGESRVPRKLGCHRARNRPQDTRRLPALGGQEGACQAQLRPCSSTTCFSCAQDSVTSHLPFQTSCTGVAYSETAAHIRSPSWQMLLYDTQPHVGPGRGWAEDRRFQISRETAKAPSRLAWPFLFHMKGQAQAPSTWLVQGSVQARPVVTGGDCCTHENPGGAPRFSYIALSIPKRHCPHPFSAGIFLFPTDWEESLNTQTFTFILQTGSRRTAVV